MPDRHGQFPSWLEYSQHLANRSNRRRKEHHAEAADYGIECIGWGWQMLRGGHVKLCILEPETVSRSSRSCHHFRNGIDPKDLAFRSDQGGYRQCWLSGTRSNIQNCLPTANPSIFDQSLRYRLEHLPDDFAVLLPERRGTTPAV